MILSPHKSNCFIDVIGVLVWRCSNSGSCCHKVYNLSIEISLLKEGSERPFFLSFFLKRLLISPFGHKIIFVLFGLR